MGETRGSRRLAIAGALFMGVLLALPTPTAALDPALDISQYAHTAWRVRDGFTKGFITSIAQTSDGYLWLGTGFGLLRFDGLRAVPWEPPANGEKLPGDYIIALLVARDGGLWIGTTKGLASWKDGKLTRHPALMGLVVSSLLEDHEGTIWAGGYAFTPPGKLCAIRGTAAECHGEDFSLQNGVLGLYEDTRGTLWAGGRDGLWQLRPGPAKFYKMPVGTYGIHDLSEDSDGTLLIPLPGRLARFVNGKPEMVQPYPGAAREADGERLLRDRDGGLWIGTEGAGLVHVHQGRTETFSQTDGLSGDAIQSLFEDREGNIWVATLGGLDRFRNFAVATFSGHQGLATIPGSGSVVATSDGSIWMGTNDGLRMWNRGEVTIYGSSNGTGESSREQSGSGSRQTVRKVSDTGLRDREAVEVFEDGHGRVLVSTVRGFGYFEKGRFIPIKGVPGGIVSSVSADARGNLWIANVDFGLFGLSAGENIQHIAWTRLGHADSAQALAIDEARSGFWLGFNDGGVAYVSAGQIRASYTAANGLGRGLVSDIESDRDGSLWIATETGLSRIKDDRVTTLTSKDGLPCDAIHWIEEDDDRSLWMYMACGLVHIAHTELDAWAAGSHRIRATLFDASDGVPTVPVGDKAGARVARAPDGKVWFTAFDGLSVFDPRHLPHNNVPPPVYIEQITADGKGYDAAHGPLPPRVRDVTIDYTALSLAAPEKVRFLLKLEGQDRDWREVVNVREVHYTNLPPKHYRFLVKACNNSGVWNEEGASLDFAIAPAYYQTVWFRAVCVAALLLVLWGLHELRLRRLAKEFNVRMDERVNERTRIARELHDTLLQSFQGVVFLFHAAVDRLPAGELKKGLDNAIDHARKAITEGRDAVQGLRASAVVTNDLAMALWSVGDEFAARSGDQNVPVLEVRVEGQTRDLHPIVRDEVYRVAGEALRNAFRHAQAGRIEAEIHYDDKQLRVRIRDDGKGIDPQVLQEEGRAGHFGLPGMHERAKLVDGTLDVSSGKGAGTEVELRIPAAIAYGLTKRA
jgi:signal transduction histidine kinase/ligand-binding sensor domain-containing protein